jgi:hypothetical protein
MSMLIEPLALRTAIAGFNGGVLVNPDLSVIESHTLDPAAAKQTVKLILDRGLDAWVYTETEWLIRDTNAPHVACETWTVKFDANVVASFTDAHLGRAVKIVGISDATRSRTCRTTRSRSSRPIACCWASFCASRTRRTIPSPSEGPAAKGYVAPMRSTSMAATDWRV